MNTCSENVVKAVLTKCGIFLAKRTHKHFSAIKSFLKFTLIYQYRYYPKIEKHETNVTKGQ